MWQLLFPDACVPTGKGGEKRSGGLLKPLPILEWKWEHIMMDFVTGLPKTPKGRDAIWVSVDMLTKSAHFLPFKVGTATEVLSSMYVQQIVRLHGVPVSIMFDGDSQFTLAYWHSLQESLGTKLNFSTAYHPQTDG